MFGDQIQSKKYNVHYLVQAFFGDRKTQIQHQWDDDFRNWENHKILKQISCEG